ncbi:transposase family protein [Sphaerisporangium sp. NPDC088356]|uniref:transposase family protein n=1 Tax=Sphaerisporangium sp. NPDC088356 TaxID=3154871 RepID=UPI00342901F2
MVLHAACLREETVRVASSSPITTLRGLDIGEAVTDPARRGDLLTRFGRLGDPRSRHGRRHSLTSVLAVVACAVVTVSGDSLNGIQQWADHAPQPVLAGLGVYRNPLTGLYEPPSERTIRRVLQIVDGQALDDQINGFLRDLAGTPPPVVFSVFFDTMGRSRVSHRSRARRGRPTSAKTARICW